MFNKILDILYELDNLPFLVIHKVIEHHLDNNDSVRFLKIMIYKLYENDFYTLIYKANCNEKSSDDYLKLIYEQLSVIKNKFIK